MAESKVQFTSPLMAAAANSQPDSKLRPPPPVDSRGPISAAVLVSTFVLYALTSKPVTPDSCLPWVLNPTGYLDVRWYLLLYMATIPSKELMNIVLGFVARTAFGFRRMDEGDGGAVRKLEVLETIDLCYLAFNTMVEFIGMNHIVAFLLTGCSETRLRQFSILNGPVAFVLVMCINDIIYYPFHLVAHKRLFYPYCHKQHHRQFVPFRGYADAANQHPLEQTYGFCIFIVSLYLTCKQVGLHASTGWCCFLSWAVLNVANHLAFDSTVHLPIPFPAYPRDHQMHHRFPQCNYSTLTSMCDRAFGTFKPYRELGVPIRHDEKTPQQARSEDSSNERPEAMPSCWSVATQGVFLCLAAVVVEVCCTGSLPPSWDVFVAMVQPVIVMFLTGVVCAASEAAVQENTDVVPRQEPTSEAVEAVPAGGFKPAQVMWQAKKKGD